MDDGSEGKKHINEEANKAAIHIYDVENKPPPTEATLPHIGGITLYKVKLSCKFFFFLPL